MKLITTLGNPGLQYKNTRHNMGFMVGDEFASRFNADFRLESKFNAEIAKFAVDGQNILICKPQTYMNLSGQSVRALLSYFKINVEDIMVVYDDITLDLGKIRFRAKGSDGGHNGIKSVISEINSDKFDRLKVGVGPQPQFMKSESFVLSNFPNDSKELLDASIKFACDALIFYLNNDIQKVQNKYN